MSTTMKNIQDLPQNVVVVNNACKTYSSSEDPVLINLNMAVQEYSIFALLGASGCGKTTLLNCILGRRKLDSGDIWLLGGTPGNPKSGVGGERVGYMPQSIDLLYVFTIMENLTVFGRLYGMSNKKIKDRVQFLTSLLDLPEPNRILATLSGGEIRRVSFAVSLIHEPELLILDEPTVGVDPILRERLWKYLQEIVSTRKHTVIITTHYIDEAMRADTVGMMRAGRLVCQDSPKSLLVNHQTDNLNTVFANLCIRDEEKVLELELPVPANIPGNNGNVENNRLISIIGAQSQRQSSKECITFNTQEQKINKNGFSFQRLMANTCTNFLHASYHPVLIFTQFALPLVILTLINLTFGGNPRDLAFGVINNEFPEDPICQSYNECGFGNLSCKFLEMVDHSMVKLIPYTDEDKAFADSVNGDLLGVIIFPANFSDSFISRSLHLTQVTNDTLINSLIEIRMDLSNVLVASFVERMLYESFENFFVGVLGKCDFNSRVGKYPIELKSYSTIEVNQEGKFPLLPITITVIFFSGVGMTAVSLMISRGSGMFERLRIAGLSASELLLSHMIVEYTLITLVIIELLLLLWILGVQFLGPYIWFIVLVSLVGTGGISTGLLIHMLSSESNTGGLFGAVLFASATWLGGIVWPVQALHITLQWFSMFLPITLPVKAVQGMANKGLGITYNFVWPGFVVSVIWIIIPLILTRLIMKRQETGLLKG